MLIDGLPYMQICDQVRPRLSDLHTCAELAEVTLSDMYKLLHRLPDRAFSEVLSTCHLRSCGEYV